MKPGARQLQLLLGHVMHFPVILKYSQVLSLLIDYVEANIFTDNLNNPSKLLGNRGNSKTGLRMFTN